jgi:hypothetical protein
VNVPVAVTTVICGANVTLLVTRWASMNTSVADSDMPIGTDALPGCVAVSAPTVVGET